ncbi:MAG: PDZ domain-containing protein [Chloracidobacterium sp.]|nr:PDZ domain-containing protein [Chloracidobacterium sp.]
MNQTFRLSLILIAVMFLTMSGFAQKTSTSAKIEPSRTVKPATSKSSYPVTPETIRKEIAEALTVIESGHVDGKDLKYNDLFKTTIDTMLHTLDPHSNYYDAKDNEQFRTEQNAEYYGIGATIGDLSAPDGKIIATYIKATFPGAPANMAGLKYGDRIVSFSGQRVLADGKTVDIKNESMLGKPFIEVRSYLRGTKGTTINLTVERAATGEKETVAITRGAVSQPAVSEAYMIRPGVGYMAMRGQFTRTIYREFVDGMISLRAQGMRQLVLDLRDNGGGLVQQAYNIARVFLSSGQTVFTQKGRIEGVTETYRSDNPSPDRSPIVMLVNRGTASASEILAGALQDHDRALIVGENTFGKGLVQNPFGDIGYDSMLLLTIAKYQTPSGRVIQRDYSNGDLYNYYTDGGSFRDDAADSSPKGVASKTDTGREVYGGGGIDPDVVIKPKTITFERNRAEQKIVSPIFAFALDLVNGRVKGFENYKIEKPVDYDYDIKASDFPVTSDLFQAFKQYAADKYKLPATQADAEREFIERTLRSELITAAYGSQTSFQVINEYDDQLLKAIDLLPRAKQLAMQSEKARSTGSKIGNPAN